jgi:epoxyqueuosine reductase
MTLTHAVKEAAHRLGFDLVGITTPDPPPHFSFFEAWLRAGRHAEMDYLASERSRARRADPRVILPECRSILVLGVRYWDPRHSEAFAVESGELHGRVAAYAWGDDYHDVLPGRLEALAGAIEELVGAPVPHRGYTDTGPILERDLAQRAGLGWIGKNSCLIHPQQGSYFLLAELLLGVALDPDPPFLPDLCGRCRRCIDACPTACILPDRSLDAGRCLSYLTIELKGAVPAPLRPLVGDWVFGCDVCQQVCPWNVRFSALQGDPAFTPRPATPRPELRRELELSPDEFRLQFKGSPVKRAKRRGYLRSVAVALGNAHDPSAIPALARALSDDKGEALVRAHAAWALGQVGGPAARAALRSALEQETDPAVLGELAAALAAAEKSDQ